MSGILNSLLNALDEQTVAYQIDIPNDDARRLYILRSIRVNDYREFEAEITRYVQHHYATCITRGARLDDVRARSLAKELIEQAYRRQGGSGASAFHDAQYGLNNGLRGVIDRLADALKTEMLRHYTRDVFDRHVNPMEFREKVALIREFFQRFGPSLGRTIHLNEPERYAHDYEPLVQAYVDAMARTSAAFRRY